MLKDKLVSLLEEEFNGTPTVDQQHFFYSIADFLTDSHQTVFILKGFAGTGKTTCLSTLTRVLAKLKKRSILIAPTGRAAKVMEQYAGKSATTIHRLIYQTQVLKSGEVLFKLARNQFSGSLFICDEASMIGSQVNLQSGSFISGSALLDDLIEYLFDADGCKIILSGDPAQLPPVGEQKSNALSPKYLKDRYLINAKGVFFKEVVRQSLESNILLNATRIRKMLQTEISFPLFDLNQAEMRTVSGYDLQEEIESCYQEFGMENCIFLTYSNKRANQFNQQIKQRILYHEGEFASGDLLMVVRNNFYWGDKEPGLNFIANGEIGVVTSILDEYEKYGFRFMKALLHFPYLKFPEVEAILNLESVHAEQASMDMQRSNELYRLVSEDYADIPSKGLRRLKIKMDKHLNALQVKFAYAVTGHKSQGGQWPVVFIDQGFLTPEKIDMNYLRWLYTCVTRASERVYLVNFNPLLTDVHE